MHIATLLPVQMVCVFLISFQRIILQLYEAVQGGELSGRGGGEERMSGTLILTHTHVYTQGYTLKTTAELPVCG